MIRSRLKKFISPKVITLLIFLIVIVLFFGIGAKAFGKGSFFTLSNLRTIFSTMVIVALLTVGAGCLIISGAIDLSAGYVGTFCGVILAVFVTNVGLPWLPALILTILLGMVFGLFNAVLVNEFGFQPFIATLATGSLAQGFTLIACNAKAIPINDSVLVWLGAGRIGEVVPVAVILAIAAFFIYGVILAKTKFGRSVYLVGGNANAAKLTGLNPKRISYILFMNGAGLAALAGSLLSARLKSGSINGIIQSNFAGITAAIIGGISFGGGSGGMGGAFLGLLIINCFNNGMTVMGISPNWQTVSSGMLLILALAFDFIVIKHKTNH